MSEKTIIEINGVKLEVDLRYAKKIEDFKIGDNIKLLLKQYEDYKSFPGVIVGFDQFKKLPTIIICYCDIQYYSNAEIKFAYFNSESKDIEICHMGDHEKTLDKKRCVDLLDEKISKVKFDLDELLRKRNYFIDQYNTHFEKLEEPIV
jgi:hypothetical protein